MYHTRPTRVPNVRQPGTFFFSVLIGFIFVLKVFFRPYGCWVLNSSLRVFNSSLMVSVPSLRIFNSPLRFLFVLIGFNSVLN